jgi:hypothetical protein
VPAAHSALLLLLLFLLFLLLILILILILLPPGHCRFPHADLGAAPRARGQRRRPQISPYTKLRYSGL